MGGVIVKKSIYDAFMRGPEHVVELFHGYTYSAHPLACAAGLATLDLYREEQLFDRAHKLEPVWGDAAMGLKGLPNVLDIRTIGLTAAVDLASRPTPSAGAPNDAMVHAFNTESLVVRVTGETIALTPPLIISESQIAELFEKVGRVIRAVA